MDKETTQKRRSQFFQLIGARELYFIGAFRNTYGELWCLYKQLHDMNQVWIIGDEIDWEAEEYKAGVMIFSYPEQEMIKNLLKK